MSLEILGERFCEMRDSIGSVVVDDWGDISAFLNSSREERGVPGTIDPFCGALGFLTFDYGIDGVSIEMAKYARSFERMCGESGLVSGDIHFIGGDFHDKAEAVLLPRWKRFHIPNINGWSKWDEGKWFAKLYYEEMPSGSEVSKEMAREMWRQAAGFAEKLGAYIAENGVTLLFPVNINSNPGNFALTLANVLVSELMGLSVLNSNHDFYWEGGAPVSERAPGESGPRDHFFKNMDNEEFFSLFRMIYPWNGNRWAQVNINTRQSDTLAEQFGIPREALFELSTTVSDDFFEEYGWDDVAGARRSMMRVLSDGAEVVSPVSVDAHLAGLSSWMEAQKPVVCGCRDGLSLRTDVPEVVYCLQPTRVVARKRIEMDLEMLGELTRRPRFREEFADPARKLVLHVTGPVPKEHQVDLERVLKAYEKLVSDIPADLAERMFIAFSVGTEDHPSLKSAGLKRLRIEDIYRMATVILFPSETEGRGLPIIESSACGVPIVCSRYYPEEVFKEVVGEDLSEELQIRYTLFPEGDYSGEFLDEVCDLMFSDDERAERITHNKEAVRKRYGSGVLVQTFQSVLEYLARGR